MKYRINSVTAFEQNSTLLWCEETKKAAVTDPGGDIDLIVKSIEEEGVELVKIILTHGHIDHIGDTLPLAKKYNLDITGPHQGDLFLFEEIDAYSQRLGLAHGGQFIPNHWLNDGDSIQIGNGLLDVVHCPGHTPGHIVLIEKQDKVAIVGDVLFKGGVGRTDFPRGNHADLMHSIKEKLLPLGDDITFISGHGPSSTFGDERRSNPFIQ